MVWGEGLSAVCVYLRCPLVIQVEEDSGARDGTVDRCRFGAHSKQMTFQVTRQNKIDYRWSADRRQQRERSKPEL